MIMEILTRDLACCRRPVFDADRRRFRDVGPQPRWVGRPVGAKTRLTR
jgi:hypothetical protein